jgi:hypothetical protein
MMSAGQLLNISKIQKRDSFCTFFGTNTVFVHIGATWFKFSNVFFFFPIFSLQKSIVNLVIQIIIFHKIDYLYNNMLLGGNFGRSGNTAEGLGEQKL